MWLWSQIRLKSAPLDRGETIAALLSWLRWHVGAIVPTIAACCFHVASSLLNVNFSSIRTPMTVLRAYLRTHISFHLTNCIFKILPCSQLLFQVSGVGFLTPSIYSAPRLGEDRDIAAVIGNSDLQRNRHTVRILPLNHKAEWVPQHP